MIKRCDFTSTEQDVFWLSWTYCPDDHFTYTSTTVSVRKSGTKDGQNYKWPVLFPVPISLVYDTDLNDVTTGYLELSVVCTGLNDNPVYTVSFFPNLPPSFFLIRHGFDLIYEHRLDQREREERGRSLSSVSPVESLVHWTSRSGPTILRPNSQDYLLLRFVFTT